MEYFKFYVGYGKFYNFLCCSLLWHKVPKQKEFFSGFQTHFIFKRDLEDNLGKIKSMQQFLLLSYGLFDWLALDLKAGGGDIRQYPTLGPKADYPYNFAGGYGLRLKLYDTQKIKMVFGFQHISVHPKSIHLQGIKNKAVLDDWQTSLLVSYDFGRITPYLGTRWSRLDYIHWQDQKRKRIMSRLDRSWALILGIDFSLNKKIWLNLEGSYFDSEALSASLNFSF